MSRRHHSKQAKLNMGFDQRKALVRSQLNGLIENGLVVTTEARAKLIKSLFDKLSSRSKDGTLHHIREAASTLANSKNAIRLIKVITPNMAERTGGFTKITKLSVRRGDAAKMVKLELTVAPVEPKAEKVVKKAKPIVKDIKKPLVKKATTK